MNDVPDQNILFFEICATIAKLTRDEYRGMREFLVVSARNRSEAMQKIVEEIAKLSDEKFKELRTWMFMNPSLIDWIELMKT